MPGLPRAIIKKYGVTKKAWAVFRGRHSSKPKTQKVGKKRMARRRFFRRRHRRGGMTVPLGPVIGLAAGIIPTIPTFVQGDYVGGIDQLAYAYLGVSGIKAGSPQFDPNGLVRGLLPLAVGLAVHKFIGGAPLNANRALAAARVPLIRI